MNMLSFISLYPDNWQEDSYVSLCGVSGQAMWWVLEQRPEIRKVSLCLDNDEAGYKAVARLSAELKEKGYEAEALLPSLKDWNDDLCAHAQYSSVALEMR